MTLAIERLFGLSSIASAQLRRNFLHLYIEIFWVGVFNGSIAAFLSVYASRLGATPFQVGLITAAPPLMNILLTMPASVFIRGRPTFQMMRTFTLAARLLYIPLVALPVLLAPQAQIWGIIALTLLINAPGTVGAVVTNTWFARATTEQHRGQVVGIRNAMLAIASMLTVFISGQVLNNLGFTTGYVVVFSIGILGLMMSTLHVFFTRPVEPQSEVSTPQTAPPEIRVKTSNFRFDILAGPFRGVLVLMFLFQIANFIPSPIFPLYQVNALKLTDEVISLGGAIFWIIYAFTSTRNSSISRRLGYRLQFGLGTVLIGIASLIFVYSYSTWIYMVCQFVSGLGWAIIGGAQINYLFERCPSSDLQPYLTWYNLAINAAGFLCGLVSPLIANATGLMGGMLVTVAVRFLVGIIIIRWG